MVYFWLILNSDFTIAYFKCIMNSSFATLEYGIWNMESEMCCKFLSRLSRILLLHLAWFQNPMLKKGVYPAVSPWRTPSVPYLPTSLSNDVTRCRVDFFDFLLDDIFDPFTGGCLFPSPFTCHLTTTTTRCYSIWWWRAGWGCCWTYVCEKVWVAKLKNLVIWAKWGKFQQNILEFVLLTFLQKLKIMIR